MDDRVLLKAMQIGACAVLHLISRSEPRSFWFNRELIAKPIDDRLIEKDGYSFAEIRPQAECIEIKFTWLHDKGLGSFTAKVETVRLPKKFWDWMVSASDGERATLALPEVDTMPEIKFQSQENLRRVVENPILRHKFSKFLSNNFQWPNAKEIILSDDFHPYSFFFQEITKNGSYGICGGVILHEGRRGCYYELHT